MLRASDAFEGGGAESSKVDIVVCKCRMRYCCGGFFKGRLLPYSCHFRTSFHNPLELRCTTLILFCFLLVEYFDCFILQYSGEKHTQDILPIRPWPHRITALYVSPFVFLTAATTLSFKAHPGVLLTTFEAQSQLTLSMSNFWLSMRQTVSSANRMCHLLFVFGPPSV